MSNNCKIDGFVIQNTVSGLKKAVAESGTDTELVLYNLQQLTDLDDLVEIDLSSLQIGTHHGDGKIETHKTVAHRIMPLLLKDNITRIVISTLWAHRIKGACRGIITDAFRQITGSHIEIDGVKVNIRDFLPDEQKLNKIVCPNQQLPDMPLTNAIKVLQEVQSMNEVPYILGNSIIKAWKHLRKLTRQARRNVNVQDDISSDSDQYNTDDDCPTPTTEDAPLSNNILKSLETNKPKRCYVCKTVYSLPKKSNKLDSSLIQYPSMCQLCAVYNYSKRKQRTDLDGKYAIVTGGRIKIGLCVALKLLRDGCNVIITTRFPNDAADRYQEETDFDSFKDRLKIYPLDFRNLNGVYRFVEYAERTFPHLDILVNNAAQTIRRPTAFFRHLLHKEETPFARLPDATQKLLATQNCLDYRTLETTTDDITVIDGGNDLNKTSAPSTSSSSSLLPVPPPSLLQSVEKKSSTHNLKRKCHTVRLIGNKKRTGSMSAEDNNVSTNCEEVDPHQTAAMKRGDMVDLEPETSSKPQNMISEISLEQFFPPGLLDEDGQQMDLRPQNSWRMSLTEVPLTELIEVLAVNAVVPFVLTQRLKTCLDKSPAPRRFVINVSAMEGQFNRAHKNHFHPHTNMAKAALNMLTRTAAVEFRDSGVYMTAVDTGWVTDERPYPQAAREENKGFILPLDCVDGAARIYDPVVTGLNKRDQEPFSAVFLKDYKPYPW